MLNTCSDKPRQQTDDDGAIWVRVGGRPASAQGSRVAHSLTGSAAAGARTRLSTRRSARSACELELQAGNERRPVAHLKACAARTHISQAIAPATENQCIQYLQVLENETLTFPREDIKGNNEVKVPDKWEYLKNGTLQRFD